MLLGTHLVRQLVPRRFLGLVQASWELPDASRSEWSVLPCPPPWQLEEEEGMLNICASADSKLRPTDLVDWSP